MQENVLTNPDEMGIVAETAVYKHIRAYYLANPLNKVGYHRMANGKDKEIDVVASHARGRIYIEDKYRDDYHIGEKEAIVQLCDEADCCRFEEIIILKNTDQTFAEIHATQLIGTIFINATHLTRLFKARTGFSPYEYLKRYRIMKAKELLLFSELSIKEIALQTGFAQISNFIHQLRELENKTPGRFRR